MHQSLQYIYQANKVIFPVISSPLIADMLLSQNTIFNQILMKLQYTGTCQKLFL